MPAHSASVAVLWLQSWWDADAASTLRRIGRVRRATNEKIRTRLGVSFRPAAQSLVDAARSLIGRGIIAPPPPHAPAAPEAAASTGFGGFATAAFLAGAAVVAVAAFKWFERR